MSLSTQSEKTEIIQNKVFVYDLPTRLFHWIFAILFLFSFIVAKTVDDESIVFTYHMISGLVMAVLVIFRIFWGLFGTHYARFINFNLSPNKLIKYIFDLPSNKSTRFLGHNPASSWAALIMMISTVGLVGTGLMMVSGQKEAFEDIHELFSTLFIITVVLHLIGIVFHTLKYKDLIGLSMLDGHKNMTNAELAFENPINPLHAKNSISSYSIQSRASGVAVLILVIVFSSFGYLISNFNAQEGKLVLFGKAFYLAESENESESESENEEMSHESKVFDQDMKDQGQKELNNNDKTNINRNLDRKNEDESEHKSEHGTKAETETETETD